MFGTIQMDVYMNIYVSEAAIPQIAAIRYCTLPQKNRIRVPPFCSVSRLRAAVCRISAHSCPSYTSLAFALFIFFLKSIYHQIAFETRSKHDVFFSSSEAKSRRNVPPAGRLQRGPPGPPPAGPPHQPGGSGIASKA